MQRIVGRRRALTALTTVSIAAALAGCGGDDGKTTGNGGGGDGDDAQALLKESFLNVSLDGKPVKSGAFDFKISGKIDAPKDDEVQAIEGSATMKGAVAATPEGAAIPPFTLAFDVDGSYTDGKGKKNDGAYKGGISYVGDTFFANWDGTDYAVGEELSKQLLTEVEKAGGMAGTSPMAGYDPQKIVDAMDLDAGTWLKDPKVEDGGTVDGVETQKISGAVDPAVVADDITEGLRNLPKAMPELPGVKELSTVTDASDEDIAEVKKAVKKLDLAVWIGKDDKLQRRMTLDVDFDTQEDGEPISGNVLLDVSVTKLNQEQDIAAPKQTQPITDLFLKLQGEFGDLFGGGGAGAVSGGTSGA